MKRANSKLARKKYRKRNCHHNNSTDLQFPLLSVLYLHQTYVCSFESGRGEVGLDLTQNAMGDFKPDSRTTEPPTLEALGTGALPVASHSTVPGTRLIVPRSPLQTTFFESIPSHRMADPIDSAL